jgi:hypothetical protein
MHIQAMQEKQKASVSAEKISKYINLTTLELTTKSQKAETQSSLLKECPVFATSHPCH